MAISGGFPYSDMRVTSLGGGLSCWLFPPDSVGPVGYVLSLMRPIPNPAETVAMLESHASRESESGIFVEFLLLLRLIRTPN